MIGGVVSLSLGATSFINHTKPRLLVRIMATFPAYENIQFVLILIDEANVDDSWGKVKDSTSGKLTDWGVSKLREGLDDYVKTVLVEMPYVCEDYGSLHRHFYGRKFRERPSKCVRLHFFNKQLSERDILLSDASENYIGFSVIEPLARRCIGRTIIDPAKIGHDLRQVHLLTTVFNNRIGGLLYRCQGFPYRTQSNEATVCAHVTMWAVCRFLSTKFRAYRKHLPFELIEMAGRRNGRVVPHHGLSYADYSEMLDRFGCHPVIVSNHGLGDSPFSDSNREITNEKEYAQFLKNLYCYIESGFPLIATFGGHVVSIVGHVSLDNDQAKLRAEPCDAPIHASVLVDEYVVMDDNFFPYQIIQRSASLPPNYPRNLRQLRGFVVPLPDQVYLRPQDVDNFIVRLMKKQAYERIIDSALADLRQTEPIVYRPFLTTGVSFKQFKHKRLMDTPGDLAIRLQLVLSLPRFIWCVELSTPSLREEDRAFGEILLDATAGESDLEPIFVRIGSEIIRSKADDGESRVDYYERNAYSDFAQYRHNLGAPPPNV